MKTSIRLALVVICLVIGTSTAQADEIVIITPGIWSPATAGAFYDGLSLDCAECGIGFLLADYPNLEYLHDAAGEPVPFQATGFDSLGLTESSLNLSYDGESGIFSYDFGAGHLFNSVDNYGQFAWFRSTDAEGHVLYIGGIEESLLGDVLWDRDYNDSVFSFERVVGDQAVPEPATVLLLGAGLLAAGRRRFARGRP
jgi:hypothetical protein